MSGREDPVNPDNILKTQKYIVGECLDVGCGKIGVLGDVRLDIDESVDPDVVHDLEEGLPFNSNSFDTVCCLHVLEHLENDLNLVEEMKRVARKRVVAIVPVGERNDPDHEREFTREEVLGKYNPDETDISSAGSYFDIVLIWNLE